MASPNFPSTGLVANVTTFQTNISNGWDQSVNNQVCGSNLMNLILDILGSAGFGSLLGGIFGYLTKREERENLQLKMSHEVDMLRAKTAASIQAAKLSLEQSKVVGSLQVEDIHSDLKAFEITLRNLVYL